MESNGTPATLPVIEIFDSIQGEGYWTGTPMTFVRLRGCNVGKRTCVRCDTDFQVMTPSGGIFTEDELFERVKHAERVCITGGEPLLYDLMPLVRLLSRTPIPVHIETSGTLQLPMELVRRAWITVSPKPGFLNENLDLASEIKIIEGGLGPAPGWLSLQDADDLTQRVTCPVFIQPSNKLHELDPGSLRQCVSFILTHPRLRLSVQLHKLLNVR